MIADRAVQRDLDPRSVNVPVEDDAERAIQLDRPIATVEGQLMAILSDGKRLHGHRARIDSHRAREVDGVDIMRPIEGELITSMAVRLLLHDEVVDGNRHGRQAQ